MTGRPAARKRQLSKAKAKDFLKLMSRRMVKVHFPYPSKSVHPSRNPVIRYCICGEAIVEVAGVWWHIYRPLKAPKDAPDPETIAKVLEAVS